MIDITDARCNHEDCSVNKGRTDSGRPVAWVTKLCMVARNIFSIITAFLFVTHRNVCQYTCTEKKAPNHGEVYISVQICGRSV